jgi:DNA-binding transcriptional LysR family regulator
MHHADFVREDIDVAVRHGDGNWPGLDVTRLCPEEIFAICSPQLLHGPKSSEASNALAPAERCAAAVAAYQSNRGADNSGLFNALCTTCKSRIARQMQYRSDIVIDLYARHPLWNQKQGKLYSNRRSGSFLL